LATLWGSYLARETERFFGRWKFFTVLTDFIFDLFVGVLYQIPAKELGEAIRESATPAYVRAGETVRYELALFHNDQARMSQSMSILMASDAELEREIANMFNGYSTKQLGREMQRINVPVEDRTVLLSDNGAGYISQQFNQYLHLVGIRHITASPFHPQTNGKIERYHRTIKGEINQVPYDMPSELKKAIRAFIEYYNYRRYKSLLPRWLNRFFLPGDLRRI
jgi:hypothetical protein